MVVTKKKTLISIILILIILSVTSITISVLLNMGFGMTAYSENSTVDLSTDVIVDNIIEEFDYTDISRIDSDRLSKYYDLDNALIAEATVYVSNNSDSGFEISCFKLNDDSDYAKLETIIKDHLNSTNSHLQKLNPKESQKLVNSRIEHCAPYVLVVVADNSNSVVTTFRNFVLGESKK